MQGMFQDVPLERRKFTSLIVPKSVNGSSISNKASGKAFQGLKTRHRARLGSIEGRKEGRKRRENWDLKFNFHFQDQSEQTNVEKEQLST